MDSGRYPDDPAWPITLDKNNKFCSFTYDEQPLQPVEMQLGSGWQRHSKRRALRTASSTQTAAAALTCGGLVKKLSVPRSDTSTSIELIQSSNQQHNQTIYTYTPADMVARHTV